MTRITGKWVADPGAQAVCAMLNGAGYQAYFVGGCVRNELLGAPISDIDIATDALPERVVELAKQTGFRPVPTGIEHGTVTVVVEGHPFEITTYRRDIETDGRRATVAYARTMEEDAHRRDFTMNALFAAPDGTVVDPLGGLDDLRARRVRFIDDAGERIREDYLRILRFFRFHAWYGDAEAGLDAEGLAACAENSAGLETLSRERVGQEMRKLLAAPNPAPAVAAMERAGVLAHVLPGATSRVLPVLVDLETRTGAGIDPVLRLASLGGEDQRERLRLSRHDARLVDLFLRHRGTEKGAAELAYRLGRDAALGVLLLNSALLETDIPPGYAEQLDAGGAARFPVTAHDLMPQYHGEALGRRLSEIEDRWIASGFTLTREELLE